MTAAATIATVATNAGDFGDLSARQDHRIGDLSDTDTVRLARDGDHKAFRILVKRHESSVYALALQLLRNPDWALNWVQEAFIVCDRALCEV